MAIEEITFCNQDNQPFSTFWQADWLREILTRETLGKYYWVDAFDALDSVDIDKNESGFVVKGKSKDALLTSEQLKEREQRLQQDDHQTIASPVPTPPHSRTKEHVNKVYHPALRTYVLHIPLILFFLTLVFFAVEVWLLILSLLGLQGLPVGINPALIIKGTQMIGSLGVIWLMGGILVNFYGTALVIDQHGLSYKQGIISRDETQVRFSEIRTIGLRQGIVDRLLNIGILEFASSGTDDVDIRFINMPNPSMVKSEIEELIEQRR